MGGPQVYPRKGKEMKKILFVSFIVGLVVGVSSCGTVHVNVKKATCEARGVIDGDEIDRCEVSKKVL